MSNATSPAFPIVTPDMPVEGAPGLTKREYFAAMAMQGLAPHYAQGGDAIADVVAKLAVQNADALLAELAKVQS